MRLCRFSLPALALFLSVLCGTWLAGCSSGVTSGGGGTTNPGLTFVTIPTQTYGAAPFTVSATSASSAAITYTVVSGPATISGSTVTITGTGTVGLSATQPASMTYSAGTAVTSFVVTPATPMLTFATIPAQTYGNAPFTVSASSASAGAIAYAATSGPAVVVGNSVTLTGAGTVVVTATQAAATNYNAATASVNIPVALGTPSLSFAPIETQVVGNVPFTVKASSASTGAVTYAVTSGPATISGNTVTLTGAGTVALGASQAATSNFSSATASTSFTTVTAGTIAGTSLSGTVQAGGLPVIGASVQLYSAGTSGNGSTANTRLAAALTTDANGHFTVPSTFTCTGTAAPLYLIAKGGKAGSTGSVNSALWLMAPLPPCGSLTNATTVTINELTTVGSAAALAQFYTTGGNIGSSGTNTQGLNIAIVNAQSLVNMPTGVSPGLSIAATVAVNSTKLNTLANAFTACAVSSSACTPLFAAATVGTGAAPTNTLDAAFSIARNPVNNAATIFGLSTGVLFAPALTTAPPDWTEAITISGGGLSSPTALGVDGSGNLWSANYNEVLSEFSPNGSPVYTNGITGSGLHESYGMAIDAANNIWVVNDETPGSPNNGGTASKFSNAGVALSSGIGYTTGLYFPTAISADTNGNMWIANYGNSTYALYSNSGTPITTGCNTKGCGYGLLEFPVAVAPDNFHFGWVANQSSNTMTRVSADGTNVMAIACCSGASGVAVDAQGYVWAANYFGDSISELSGAGVVVSAGYTGGGVVHPQGIAVDGNGTIWIANYRGNSISDLAGSQTTVPGAALSPTGGLGSDAGMVEPYGLAIDGSGDIWVSSYGTNTIQEFVGMAVPVKTPLVGEPVLP